MVELLLGSAHVVFSDKSKLFTLKVYSCYFLDISRNLRSPSNCTLII